MADTLNLRIHLWPHPALRTVCTPVLATEFGAELAATAAEMLRIIKRPATLGIGLAANQVGITKRFFVMTTAAGEELCCVNPTWEVLGPQIGYVRGVVNMSGASIEGCLSSPGIVAQVVRHCFITLHYQRPEGGPTNNVDLNGIDARCAQHETQHLNGEYIFANLPRQQRRRVEAQWAKARPVAIAQGLGI